VIRYSVFKEQSAQKISFPRDKIPNLGTLQLLDIIEFLQTDQPMYSKAWGSFYLNQCCVSTPFLLKNKIYFKNQAAQQHKMHSFRYQGLTSHYVR
jgi:hypothetical protein